MKKHIELRMRASDFDALEELCKRAEPHEQGAFLLLRRVTTEEKELVLVDDLLLPPDDAYRTQEVARLAPSTRWMSEAISIADERGCGLGFIHSHPGDIGGPELSGADVWMNEALFPVVLDNLPGAPAGSFVLHKHGIRGVLWLDGNEVALSRALTVGSRLVERTGLVERDALAGFERQLLLWGAHGQAALAGLTVAVVGAGGTGSAVAEQLVRLGVGHVVVIDHDVLERSNITRVYGSRLDDVGKPKATVLARHLASIRNGRVTAVVGSVQDPDVLDRLKGADVVFGCTDTHASRAALNELPYKMFIPVIDVGCRVGTVRGQTDGIACEERLVEPDGPCLWCRGALSAERIHAEYLPADERAARAAEGYVTGLQEEPSVVPVTTVTATLGVMRFVDVVLGLVRWPKSAVLLDLQQLDVLETTASPQCDLCRRAHSD